MNPQSCVSQIVAPVACRSAVFLKTVLLKVVDMSGFTKLSTMLDVESLSKVINSYFDMIVSEVIAYGGDILKFAGDAFFAEWRVIEDSDESNGDEKANPLSDLNASLVFINEMACNDCDVPPLTNCVMMAAKCGTAIVKKFSDYHVTTADSRNTSEAMLNVHCGVGVGDMVGLHVGDYKEGVEEDSVELRREFLILGEPIDQVRGLALLPMCSEFVDLETHLPCCALPVVRPGIQSGRCR